MPKQVLHFLPCTFLYLAVRLQLIIILNVLTAFLRYLLHNNMPHLIVNDITKIYFARG